MSTLLTVRPYRNSDVPIIAKLVTELNVAEGYSQVLSAEQLAKVFADDAPVRVYAFVAENEGGLCGVLLYYDGYDSITDSYGCHLMDLYVSDSARRNGVGKALVGLLFAQVQELQYKWVSLTARKQNADAKAFYASLGFTEVAVDFYAIGTVAMQRLIHTA